VDIISPVLGSFKQKFLGATTEAGIRQNVRVDAIPVIIDEAESESVKGVSRMQGIMELIRQASSETGGVIAKGTVTGEATMFNVRSCFLLSSVGVAATSRPDASRITTVALERRRDTGAFARLIALADQTTHVPAYCASLRARTRQQIPTILANAKHFISAATARLGDARAGDQIGTLIAGAYSLTSTKLISAEAAKEWVESQDWAGIELDAADTDENLAFACLMQAKMRVDADSGAPWTTSVSDQVAIFYKAESGEGDRSTAVSVLRLHGMRIDEKGLAVSNTHSAIAGFFRETAWAGKWKDQLGRIPSAESGVLIKFGKAANRAVLIPKVQLV
jgi:putative DNA primase/helicase